MQPHESNANWLGGYCTSPSSKYKTSLPHNKTFPSSKDGAVSIYNFAN